MQTKLQKNYKLTIQVNDLEIVTIEPPITLQFDVVRNWGASANTLNMQIYNLAQTTRDKIFQDFFDTQTMRKVVLQAGYGDQLCDIFVGDLRKAYSERRGADIITDCMCFDSGFDVMNSYSNMTLGAGIAPKDMIMSLINNMKNTSVGEIGDVGDIQIPRGTSLIGNSFSILNKITKERTFIDMNKIYVLKENEVIEGDIPLINSETGLLGTPKREDAKLTVNTMFEPRIKVGQVIDIESKVQSQFNGQFSVLGISHSGIISETVGGEIKTTLDLLVPNILKNGPIMLVKNGIIKPLRRKINTKIKPDILALINKYANIHGVETAFVKAVIKAESGFNVFARSSAGAMGLMQLMPATARGLGITNAFDPEQNIRAGTRKLGADLRTYGGDMQLTLAAYNAGGGAVAKYHGIPPYPETRNYVSTVMGYYYSYKGDSL